MKKNAAPTALGKEKSLYVAYVGTEKIAVLRAKTLSREKTEVKALSARLSEGFERGIVKDLSLASQTLAEVVKNVSGETNNALLPCRVVVSNAYLKNYTFQSSIYFHGNPHPVTLKDVREAVAQTRSVATIPLQEVIVQAVPQEFLVNDLAGVQNPIGLEASRLGVTLRLLTLDFLVYSNLLQVFERCELEVIDIIPSVLASAHSVLTMSEKQEGVLLIAIGALATHFACYKNSVLLETRSIPFGSNCITEEIEKNLNIDHLDAQRLKEAFGSAVSKLEFQDELIPVPDSHGRRKYHIKRSEFEAQMKTGIDRFFNELRSQVRNFQQIYSPLNQLVFTGGGARLEGFLEVAQETISPMGRIGVAQGMVGPENLISNPAFSAILGGVSFTGRVSEEGLRVSGRENWFQRTFETVRNRIFEYL